MKKIELTKKEWQELAEHYGWQDFKPEHNYILYVDGTVYENISDPTPYAEIEPEDVEYFLKNKEV